MVSIYIVLYASKRNREMHFVLASLFSFHTKLFASVIIQSSESANFSSMYVQNVDRICILCIGEII